MDSALLRHMLDSLLVKMISEGGGEHFIKRILQLILSGDEIISRTSRRIRTRRVDHEAFSGLLVMTSPSMT